MTHTTDRKSIILYSGVHGTNYLDLHVGKTKEMVIDFRRKIDRPEPVALKGDATERIENYKYLGVLLDSTLRWKENTNAVLQKAHTRLFSLRKLKSLRVKQETVTDDSLLGSV